MLVGGSSALANVFSLTATESVPYTDLYIKGTAGQLSVFLVNAVNSGAKLDFASETQDSLYNVKWYSYTDDVQNLTPITSGVVTKGNKSVLSKFKLDRGYAVEFEDKEGTKSQFYVWLTKFLPIKSAKIDTSKYYCEELPIKISPVMTYKTVYGNLSTINRSEDVSYNVFEMKQGKLSESKTENLGGDSVIYISEVPTVDTPFEFVDAYFGSTFTTDTFVTYAVNAFPVMTALVKHMAEIQSESEYQTDENGNVVLYFGETGSFRSSSPFAINIKSNWSPKVNEYTWYMSKNSEFQNPVIYYTWKDEISNFTGLNSGTNYLKLEVANSKSGCSYSTTASFKIESSKLLIPNAFIPNANKNNMFKVAYASIGSYECRIYNQWGRLVFESSDINEGWDGTFNGHDLPSGVYFAVIKAEGFDGKSYNEKQTINLIRKDDE